MTKSTSSPPAFAGTYRILLVGGADDDHTQLRERLRDECGRCDVVGVQGEAGCRQALHADDLPDLVVIDESQHWSESRALADALKSSHPHIPLVMVRSLEATTAAKSAPVRGDLPLVTLSDAVQLVRDQAARIQDARERVEERQRDYEELQNVNEALAQQIDERTETVERRAQQLRLLASELTKAEERERRRLAQMLHDDLQQMLVAARMHLTAVTQEKSPSRMVDMIKHVDDLIDRSIRLSRNLTHRASPPVLYDAGLAPAFEWLGRQASEEHGLEVQVDCDDTAQPESQDTRILLYQACRELLFNVVKHAETRRCKLSMHHAGEGDVQVSVCDEGKGFKESPNNEFDSGDGFGLFSIRERLELIGGRMEIESIEGQGTCVRLYAPVQMTEVERNGSADLGRTLVEALGREGRPPLPAYRGKPVRVLLADDHRIMRASLAGLLRNQPGIEIVGQAGDGQEVIDRAQELRPDVIVMDVTMPVIDGVEATRRLMTEQPDLFVIALSMHEKEDMQRAMREAGAKRYLTKDGPPEMLVAAIRASRNSPRRTAAK